MLIASARHNHTMKSDIIINRPTGFPERQHLVILQRSPAYFTLNGKTTLIKKDTVLILKSDDSQFYMGAGESFVHDWFFVLPEPADLPMWERWNFPYNTPIRTENTIVLSNIIRNIAYYHNTRSVCRHDIVAAYATVFFWHLYESLKTTQKVQIQRHIGQYENQLSNLRRTVYEQPCAAPSAATASENMHISRSMFDQIYKSRFQTSYHSDVINSRIQQAKQLLCNTDLSLNEISEICGYHDTEHFGRQFRQRIGIPPLKYRYSKQSHN